MPAPDEELLRRYLEELSWLRSMGVRFAADHPHVASRLQLNGNPSPDPHVERLIESFAFLTARIQSDLAADFPEIAAELLQNLYPHYLNPIPSMTIVRFDPKPELAAGVIVPPKTALFADTDDGHVCRFRTSYPAAVWPVNVTAATVTSGSDFNDPRERRRPVSVLRLRLRSMNEPFEKLGIDTLRFFLNSETLGNRLYPLLLEPDAKRATVVAKDSFDISRAELLGVTPVGFEEDEAVIEYPRGSHPAYRLLQEYFAFEQKFHFIDVKGLRGRMTGTEADLLFLLDGELPARGLHPDDFVLGCTPAINLFAKVSEPIRADHREIEYELVPDYRNGAWTDIHSIVSVTGTSPSGPRQYAPFYSFTHHMAAEGQSAFWHARREAGQVLLSFRDTAFNPALPGDEVVYAHLLCTNGDYASEIEAGDPLDCDEDLSVAGIVSLRKPTRQLAAAQGGELLWRLVSHLSLNHLSIDDTDASLDALREILLLYCPADAPLPRRRIDGIRAIASRRITRRVQSAWNGFARGTEISLVFDDALHDDNGFLFASVLSRFFALHASINSFSRLVVTRATAGRGRFHDAKGLQWPIMAGGKPVL